MRIFGAVNEKYLLILMKIVRLNREVSSKIDGDRWDKMKDEYTELKTDTEN